MILFLKSNLCVAMTGNIMMLLKKKKVYLKIKHIHTHGETLVSRILEQLLQFMKEVN